MEALLLSAHVVAGILFIGPVAVATSMFPAVVPVSASADDIRHVIAARVLHRITSTYGALALVVPVAGLALAAVQGRLGEIWIVVAMVLTAVAGALLMLRIRPAQRDAIASPSAARLSGLRLTAGVFNLLWALVVVLMIARPGAA